MLDLRDRWRDFWKRAGSRKNSVLPYVDISSRYSQSHRHYHTLRHISHCFVEFDEISNLCSGPGGAIAVEGALWTHDAEYNTRASDNEERSRDYWEWLGLTMGIPPEIIKYTGELIVATKHNRMLTDPNAQLVVDIDLAILGQSPVIFDGYEKDIWKEYDWALKEYGHRKCFEIRMQILRGILDRGIYYSDYFKAKYFHQARANLLRSISSLQSGIDNLKD